MSILLFSVCSWLSRTTEQLFEWRWCSHCDGTKSPHWSLTSGQQLLPVCFRQRLWLWPRFHPFILIPSHLSCTIKLLVAVSYLTPPPPPRTSQSEVSAVLPDDSSLFSNCLVASYFYVVVCLEICYLFQSNHLIQNLPDTNEHFLVYFDLPCWMLYFLRLFATFINENDINNLFFCRHSQTLSVYWRDDSTFFKSGTRLSCGYTWTTWPRVWLPFKKCSCSFKFEVWEP